MNPIIHAEIGWLCAQGLERRRDRILVTAAAVLPDIDGVGILFSDALYAEWHHKLGHGLIAGAALSVGLGAALTVGRAHKARAFATGAALVCLAFHSHIAADLVGSGPGWPIWYLWPFSDSSWFPSWQWDLASWQNTTIGMAITLTCLAMAIFRERTPVELFSERADRRVVDTIRARFLPAPEPVPERIED
jgi:membrane-bound metal-dependent hydrolase YbcI (DUF457 family)